MNTLYLRAALVAALSLPALAHAQDPKLHGTALYPAIDAPEKAVVNTVAQFSKALQGGDLKRVGELLAEDVLILESGGAERSREQYLGHHAISDSAFLGGAHVQVKQRTVRVSGNLAWVGTESELHATRDGKAMTLLSTETMVLKKGAAGWRIVHIHWSSRPRK